jgi:hypothetical protein
MAGLVPAIHVLAEVIKAWMPGTSPEMTNPPRFLPIIGANHVGGRTIPLPNPC